MEKTICRGKYFSVISLSIFENTTLGTTRLSEESPTYVYVYTLYAFWYWVLQNLRNMENMPYQLLPQPGNGFECQRDSKRRTGPVIKVLCIALLISYTANMFFAYQRYIVPWQLAEKLPSKFGWFMFEFSCL